MSLGNIFEIMTERFSDTQAEHHDSAPNSAKKVVYQTVASVFGLIIRKQAVSRSTDIFRWSDQAAKAAQIVSRGNTDNEWNDESWKTVTEHLSPQLQERFKNHPLLSMRVLSKILSEPYDTSRS